MNKELLDIAIQAAVAAGEAILEIYHQDNFETELKSDDTPITLADKAAHSIIMEGLAATAIPVISEEGDLPAYEARKEWKEFWLVDPLDGTKEFINKNGEFTVNIALIRNNLPKIGVIYVPVTRDLYYGIVGEKAIKAKVSEGIVAERQLLPLSQNENDATVVVASRSFKDAQTEEFIQGLKHPVTIVSKGSSLKLCMVAEGVADVYPRFVNLKEWDIAAGVAIVEAAEGSVFTVEHNAEITFNSPTLAAPFFIANAKIRKQMNIYENLMQHFVCNAKIEEINPFGNGHINDTFKVVLDDNKEYLLQRINHEVFKDVRGMMDNIQKVTQHITSKGKPTLTFLKTTKGEDFYKTTEGEYWRVMLFEANTKSYEITDSKAIAEATGRAVADFQKDIIELNPKDFIEVIPLFHDLKDRCRQLDEAIENNKVGRIETVQEEVDYSYSLRENLLNFYEEEQIPLRVTHNDTKLNNILFTEDEKPLCLVDLDTLMPGFVHYDFGDVVRTMCNTAVEDEPDLDKVHFNKELYQAYRKGYLSIASDFLTEKEKEWLDSSGKLMTYIMGIRFLTDYLNGDVYYKTEYPMHNYDRARCQFKLLKEMDAVLT